jgi:hypothetical protein
MQLDWHLVLLNHKLKTIFDRSIASDTLDKKSIENQAKELVRVCTDEVMLFQAEIATIPDVISEMLRAYGMEQVRGSVTVYILYSTLGMYLYGTCTLPI